MAKKKTTTKPIGDDKDNRHPNLSRGVAAGFIEWTQSGKTLRYNWEMIGQVWAVDTQHNTIKKFAHHWGLPYQRCRVHLRKQDKHQVDENRARLGRMVLDSITLPDQTHIQDAGELIGRVLGDALDNIQAINQYVSANLLNVGANGERRVNTQLPSNEVARLALTQKRATDQLTRLLEVQREVREETDVPHDSTIAASEEPVPDQRDVIARITDGGIAEVSPAEEG